MSNTVERLGRKVRRTDRLKTKIEMLPTLRAQHTLNGTDERRADSANGQRLFINP